MTGSEGGSPKGFLQRLPLLSVPSVLLALLTLVGWYGGKISLAAFGADFIPMAPSTAVLFLLFGWIAALDPGAMQDRIRLVRGLLSAGLVVALALLVLSLLGIAPGLEHPGLDPIGTVGGAPTGHMSPLTAACFLLAGLALLVASSPRRTDTRALQAAALLGGAVLLVNGFLLLAYLLGGPLLYGTGVIPPALPTVMAFLSLGLGITGPAGRRLAMRSEAIQGSRRRTLVLLLALYLAMSGGIIGIAYMGFQSYRTTALVAIEQQLADLGDFSVRNLTQWHEERLGDARAFFGTEVFADLVSGLRDPGREEGARARISGMLERIQEVYGYDRVSLWDQEEREIIAVPDSGRAPGPVLREAVAQGRGADRPRLVDFYRPGPGQPVLLGIVAPVGTGDPASAPGYVVTLRIDPEVQVYPRLDAHRLRTETGELLLVRREGDEVVFLNNLRFDPDAALRLRFPADRTDLPAAMAVRGQTGVVEGIDYRGVRVKAVIRAVPGTPWYLVERMDIQEISAPAQERLWSVVLSVSLLLIVAAAAIGLVWEWRVKGYYQELYRAEAARQEAEVAAAVSREEAEQYLELINTILVGLDREGHVVLINRAGHKALGYEQGDLKGADWFATCIPDEEREEVRRIFQRTMAGDLESIEYFENHVLTRDGEQRLVAWHNSVVTDEEGTPVTTLSSGIDITDQRQIEEEKDLLQQQLLQVQKMESVGRLAGGVAHDFNNMLSVILGHVDIALSGEVDEEDPLHHRLSEIRTVTERSMALTRQLLAFARKQTIQPRVLDLNHTVEGMLKMLRRLIGEDIDLAWLPEGGLWSVHLDPAQVDQMLANLLVNARDAISGVGQITIETENVTIDEEYAREHAGFVPGDYVMLAVSDDGSGIEPGVLEQIFDPFFTTKASGKGTGLGLSTVYGIVKQNEGFIHVYSEPGEGTTFKIYLSRHEGAEVENRESPQESEVAGGDETIMVVEDNPSVLALSREILEKLGYQILAVDSAPAALEQARDHEGPIDLLLTDVVMPEMNGRQLSEQISTLHPGIKTLFMSGYTADVIAHRGVLDEGVQFIQKPLSSRALAERVRNVLDL